MAPVASHHFNGALVRSRITYLCECHTLLVEVIAELLVVFGRNLHHDTGVLRKQGLHDIALTYLAEVDMHTTFYICERHFEKCGDKTSGADVVTTVYPSAADHLLHSVERVGEVFGVLHCRHVVAYLAKTLCEGRTSKALLVEREVDIIERSLLVVYHHRTDDFSHVSHLSATAYYHCSRRNHLLSVRILLRHRERVFSSRHVDIKCAAEVAESLHCTIESCVLTFLRAAGPHPVGREAYSAESVDNGCKHDVGERLSH